MIFKLTKQSNVLPGNEIAIAYLCEGQLELGGTYIAMSVPSPIPCT